MFAHQYTIALALSFLSLFAISSAQADSLTDVLATYANLSSFQSLLRDQFPLALKALETFNADTNPITILAPNNQAFDSILSSDVLSPAFANNDTAAISQLLSYHVLMGVWTSQTLNYTFKFLPSMTSGSNFSDVSGGQRVGAVLQPGDTKSDYEFEIVFTSGESTRSIVKVQDILFAGGVIQVIENFLIPPIPFVPTAESYSLANIPYAITAFLGAVYSLPNTTRLAGYLNDTRDLTIFIPANVAFEMVSPALEAFSDSPAPDLLDLLEYHVLVSANGPIYSSSFANATTLETINNKTLQMSFYPNSYYVNSARIITSDILIYNGVVHIIDNVLSPNASAAVPNPTSATQIPVLQTATGSVNTSVAPYTTYLPNYIPPEITETATATESDYFYNRASSTSDGATVTASKKSDASARPLDLPLTGGLGVWSLIALMFAFMFMTI